ncbi:protein kinase 3-like isoform X2 [Symsagittifera roscoffensis]|uniref:protein kinase 3-like isoform X2 n=1 Tax=Symsagittifera roscoffensis TaxID=84072 RepID=UPI00307BAB4C
MSSGEPWTYSTLPRNANASQMSLIGEAMDTQNNPHPELNPIMHPQMKRTSKGPPNRPPPSVPPLGNKFTFHSTEMLLGDHPHHSNPPSPSGNPGAFSPPISPYPMVPLHSPTYLAQPGNSNTAPRAGRKLQELKQSLFASWGRKQPPSFQHGTQQQNAGQSANYPVMDPAISLPASGFAGVPVYMRSISSSTPLSPSQFHSQASQLNRIGQLGEHLGVVGGSSYLSGGSRDRVSLQSSVEMEVVGGGGMVNMERFSFRSSMSDEPPIGQQNNHILFSTPTYSSKIALDSSTGHLSSGGGSQGTVGVGEGGQEGGSSLPCTVMAVCDYEAAKEDHISVKAGDTIQVLSVSSSRLYYVFREGNGQDILDAEGYVPWSVINGGSSGSTGMGNSQESLSPRSPVGGQSTDRLNQSLNMNLPPAQRSSWHSTIQGKLLEHSSGSGASRETVNMATYREAQMRNSQYQFNTNHNGERGRESNRTRKTKSAASLSHLFKANNNINNNNNNPNSNTNNNSNGTASSLSHSVVNTLRRKSKSRQRSSSKASSGASSSSRLQLFLGGENPGSHYVIGNRNSASDLTVADGRPGEPGKPEILKKSRTCVEIGWSAPLHTGNQLITGYTIELARKDSSVYSQYGGIIETSKDSDTNSNSLSAMVEDLTPGVCYQFRVSAHNHSGISLPSEASDPVTISASSSTSTSTSKQQQQQNHNNNNNHLETNGKNNKKKGGRLWDDGADKVTWSQKFDDHFTKVEEIAKGRFSTVWKCEQKKTGRTVAAKIVNGNMLDKRDIGLEVTLMNSVHSCAPHLFLKATHTYVHPQSNSLVLILPLVGGGRGSCRLLEFLVEHYGDNHTYSEVVACSFLRQVAEALQYLHLNHIAHLDVKPENLLVEATSQSANVKLIDFGDARRLTTHTPFSLPHPPPWGDHFSPHPAHPISPPAVPHCVPGTPLGSFEFCAPELIDPEGGNGFLVTCQADMWSLGCVLYVLLTGLSPFLDGDDSREETCRHILHSDFALPEEHFSDTSPHARHLIMSLLNRDPSLRLTSSGCLGHPWFAHFSPSPSSSPPIPVDRLQNFINRRQHCATDVRPLKRESIRQLLQSITLT